MPLGTYGNLAQRQERSDFNNYNLAHSSHQPRTGSVLNRSSDCFGFQNQNQFPFSSEETRKPLLYRRTLKQKSLLTFSHPRIPSDMLCFSSVVRLRWGLWPRGGVRYGPKMYISEFFVI